MTDPRPDRRGVPHRVVNGDLEAVGVRIGHALARTADRYAPSFELDQVVHGSDGRVPAVDLERATTTGPRRHHRTRYAAAVFVLAVGGAAIVQANRTGDDSSTISPSDPTAALDGNLLDAIDTTPPEHLAILDPAPRGSIPQRANPYFMWLMGEPAPELRRTFAVVGDDGLPSAALTVTDGPDELGLRKRWEDLPVADVDGVDARISQSGAVAWPSARGITTVSGIGDTDLDVVTDYAAQVVDASGVSAAPAPAGFTELDEMDPLGSVTYSQNGSAHMSLSLYRGDSPLAWWMMQFIPLTEADTLEAAPGDDGWVLTPSSGPSYAWIDAGDRLWAGIVSPYDPIDPATIALQVRVVAGDEVQPMSIVDSWTFGVPDDTELVAAGELSTGRFLVLKYENLDLDRACVHVVLDYEPRGFPRTRSCSTGDDQLGDCWTAHDPDSDVGQPYVVWVDDVVDTITITINGELVAPAVEHVSGLTLASGHSPQTIDTIEATTRGAQIC